MVDYRCGGDVASLREIEKAARRPRETGHFAHDARPGAGAGGSSWGTDRFFVGKHQ